jgi:putative oxidoreductase
VFTIAIGVVELAGGLLLIAGVRLRPAALVLAGDMAGAIVVSGIARGELISLTLAPAQLTAMIVIVWSTGISMPRVRSPHGRRRAGR